MRKANAGTEATRKKHIFISHNDIVDFCVKHPKADTEQIAKHFGIHRRTAQKHMKIMSRYVE